jgi:ribosomal protein S18 acetylase RimI-like enzyme
MKIRLARDEDHAGIARLRRHTIRNVNAKDYSEEAIRHWSAKGSAQDFQESADTCKRWVALDKDRIIGFCEHNFECELSRIYVHQNYLRTGVGSRLLEVAEASLEKQGCKEIRLESTVTAKAFYLAKGYEIIARAFYKENKNQLIYKMLRKLP